DENHPGQSSAAPGCPLLDDQDGGMSHPGDRHRAGDEERHADDGGHRRLLCRPSGAEEQGAERDEGQSRGGSVHRLPTQAGQQSNSCGTDIPLVPNVALDRVRLGAPPRRPAMEISPTMAKEPNAPRTATSTACQIERPSATKDTPSGRPSTEMLAANHTQNSSIGFPRCSAGGTGSMPRCSAARRVFSAVSVPGCERWPGRESV